MFICLLFGVIQQFLQVLVQADSDDFKALFM